MIVGWAGCYQEVGALRLIIVSFYPAFFNFDTFHPDASHMTWKERKDLENQKVVSLGGKVRSVYLARHTPEMFSITKVRFLP